MPDISNILQNPNIPIIAIVCGGMCLISIALLVILPIITGTLSIFASIFDIIGGIIGAFTTVLAGGPIAWCGCLFFLMMFAICGGMVLIVANILSTCGTPDQVLFCRLF